MPGSGPRRHDGQPPQVSSCRASPAAWPRTRPSARRASAGPLGANDAVRVAVIGVRGKGNHHLEMLRAITGVRVVALCDVDETILNRRAEELSADGIQVAKHVDVRKLLESKDVDAVTIATPNHWHSLMAIWACQAGKDVYVEKPISHNVWEGRKVVEAAAKYNRIVAGRHAVPLRRGAARARGLPAQRRARQDPARARLLLQAAREHRQGRRPAADPRRRQLRPVLRAGAARAAAPRAAALRLALGLGHRQRRHRQPGRPRDGHVPLDAR